MLLLFWLLRSEFDNVRDGFIYGALVGIGFNLLEAPFYITNGFRNTGDIPLYFQIADRFALFGLSGHALYTGLFGMGLGLARQTTRRWLQIAAPIGGWLLGFSGHFLNNALGLFLALSAGFWSAVCIVISGPFWTRGWPEWWGWWLNLPIWSQWPLK